jgi:outer membrane protein
MKLHSRVFAAILSSAILLFGFAARAEMKVAVVDVQRAVLQTEDGLRAQATLKKVTDGRMQELQKRQADLQKQREDLEKQQKTLAKEVLQKRAEEWQKATMEFQAAAMEYDKELQKKQKELTDPIMEKVLGIVKRLAQQEGFDMVVDRQAVPYFRSDLDLTDRCIQAYNVGGTPAAAGKAPAPAKAPATAPVQKK